MDEREQDADEEMQLTNVDEQNAKEEPEASGEKRNAEEDALTKKIKVAREETSKEVPDEGEVEPDAEEKEETPYVEPGTKSANKASLKNVMTQNQIEQAPACGSKDLMAVCASMDANKLARFICGRDTSLGGYLPTAMRCAPDAAALVLQVVKLFLSDKRFKATKVWNRCVGLICCVSATASKPSADTIEQAKQVAKDWKEMTDKLECPGDHHMLGAWGLLHFITSYNIVLEFEFSEIIRLFGMVPRHKQKKNTIKLCKGLGISDRITDLIDYLIGKGQHLDVFHLANVFNLSDKYPLLSLLKGYIETAKQTSMEIQSKSLISAIPKEITNLWVAYHLADQKITDSSQRSTIMAEIKVLLNGYAKKKNGAKACTSNSQPQQKQDNKKRKKVEQELHKGQENVQQREQSKAREQDRKQTNQQQKQHKEARQMRESEHQQRKSRPQEMQQHLKRPRPCTVKLPTPAVPMVLNVGQMGHLGRPPCSGMPGGSSYATQPGWPGAGGVPPFAPPFGAAQFIRPFNPFYPHPQFYPR